jgi:hypothetical protein
MMNRFPIYIPSRGRYEKNLTANLLKEEEIPFKLVVEPQDAHNYFNAFGGDSILILPENNQGVSYVRNWIKDYSKEVKEEYHWQIDDDIRHFKRRIDNKNVNSSAMGVLTEAEDEVVKYSNVGAAGLSSFVFAWASKQDVKINKQVYTVMLFNNATPVRFTKDTIEDLDYSLRVLYAGWCTLFFTRIMFEAVPTMKQKGGNTDMHFSDNGRYKLYLKIMEDFPGWFQFKDKPTKDGIVSAKPSRIWKTFTQKPVLKETHEP